MEYTKSKTKTSIIITILLVTSLIIPLASAIDKVENDTIFVLYDETNETTSKLTMLIETAFENQDFGYKKQNSVNPIEDLTKVDAKHIVLAYHGNEKGLIVNDQLYSWKEIQEKINMNLNNKYIYLLSCYSANIEINNHMLHVIDGKEDYYVAYLKFLLTFHYNVKNSHTLLSHRIFAQAQTFLDENTNEILQRILFIKEPLQHYVLDSSTSLQYGYLYETVEQIKNTVRTMAKIIALQHTNLEPAGNLLGFLLDMISGLGVPFIPSGFEDSWNDWKSGFESELENILEQAQTTQQLNDIVDFLATTNDVLDPFIGFLNYRYGINFIAELQGLYGHFLFSLQLVLTVYLWAEASMNSNTNQNADSMVLTLDREIYNSLFPYINYTTDDVYSLYDRLEDISNAILNDIDSINPNISILVNPTNPTSNRDIIVNIFEHYSKPLGARDVMSNDMRMLFESTMYRIQTLLASVYNHLNPWFIQNPLDVAYVNATVTSISMTLFSTTITINYKIDNYGGNQIKVTRIDVNAHETSNGNTATKTHYVTLLPVDTLTSSLSLSKKWCSLPTVTVNFIVIIATIDSGGGGDPPPGGGTPGLW